MSRLLPSLQETNRYLAFAVEAAHPVFFKAVSQAVWQHILGFIGSKGAAEAGVWILPDQWNQKAQQGILKATHTHVHACKAALALLHTIEGKPAMARSLGMSGTLAKAQGYLSG
ncbi:hypothetical protein HY491_04085 [Candidatus Woesearchaeota archaeon]|nr:hypothetical protein [Candidatus Woesearchaeota archaeon]